MLKYDFVVFFIYIKKANQVAFMNTTRVRLLKFKLIFQYRYCDTYSLYQYKISTIIKIKIYVPILRLDSKTTLSNGISFGTNLLYVSKTDLV